MKKKKMSSTNKKIKKIRTWFWICYILSLLTLLMICLANGVSKSTVKVVFGIYIAVVLIAIFVIDILFVSKLTKNVNALLPILNDENDPDRYLEQLTDLIGDAKSPLLKAVFCINSSVAYFDKGEYEKAREVLSKVNLKKVPLAHSLLYYLDMALICIHLEDYDTAMDIWEKKKHYFENLPDNTNIGSVVSDLRIFSLIREGKKDEALAQIEEDRKKWTRVRDQKEYAFLEEMASKLTP